MTGEYVVVTTYALTEHIRYPRVTMSTHFIDVDMDAWCCARFEDRLWYEVCKNFHRAVRHFRSGDQMDRRIFVIGLAKTSTRRRHQVACDRSTEGRPVNDGFRGSHALESSSHMQEGLPHSLQELPVGLSTGEGSFSGSFFRLCLETLENLWAVRVVGIRICCRAHTEKRSPVGHGV